MKKKKTKPVKFSPTDKRHMHTCSKWVCRLIPIIPCSICLVAYFGRQHPSLPLRKTGKNLKWTFLLTANASELLEVKAKASMCHPLLTHGKKFDIKDFQSLRCSIFKKSYSTGRVQQLIKKAPATCQAEGRGSWILITSPVFWAQPSFQFTFCQSHGWPACMSLARIYPFKKHFSITLHNDNQTSPHSPGSRSY